MTPYRENALLTCGECASTNMAPYHMLQNGWAARQLRELYPDAVRCLDCGTTHWDPENEKSPSACAEEP